MLRNRPRNARKKNTRNVRARNTTKTARSSDDWDSSCSPSEYEDSENTDESSLLSSPRCRRKPSSRKNTASKSNKRSTSKKSTQKRNDFEEAGPSSASTSSYNSRSQDQSVTNKRKCKENTKIFDSDESSSDDFLNHNRVKRIRHSDLDTDDDSDDSVIQPLAVRRNGFIQSDSSNSSSSVEIIRGDPIHSAGSSPYWTSDDTDNGAFDNSVSMDGITESSISSSSSSSSSYSNSSTSSMSSSILNLYANTSSLNALFSADNYMSTSTESSNQESTTSFVNVRDQVLSSDSDDSDPDGEKCAICLKKFRTQQIGSPSNCDHSFCRKCLEEWSKSSTTCPVDRSVFNAILVRNELGGDVVERIEVQNRNFAVFPPVDMEEMAINETIICETCGSGDDEETLLLCDLCNLGYHMACLDPPLEVVPAGAWYCPPCRLLYGSSNQNVREAMRQLINNLPLSSVTFSPSSSRQNPLRSRANRIRTGPSPRGRGPSVSRRARDPNARDDEASVIQNVLDTHVEDLRSVQRRRNRRIRQRRARNDRQNRTREVAAQVTRYLAEMTSSSTRLTPIDSQSMSRPSEIVDMVFPSFSLFGNNDLDYFSDDQNDDGLDGEVAIMARVRSEYSARRVGNRKNIATSLMNPQRLAPVVEVDSVEEVTSSTSLLDSILKNQTLWHSKNVDISSKKDGKLEIKLKEDENKRPDLSNASHSFKEIPLYPNKNESSSSDTNKSSYTNNTGYSNFSGNSSSGSSSFSQSTSFFSSLNPSRPGFSNLLGNNSAALDLSPFRGSAPVRFRMNPPTRSGIRRPNYNSNSARHMAANSVATSNTQSPKKASSAQTTASGEEDVDLYEDIETENAEDERSTEMYASLEPPPEPPTLLIGSDSSSDEDNGLVIDDKSKNNIYDPTDPNEDSDVENNQMKNLNVAPDYMRSPSYGGISEFGPHLPLPEPPALPIELESVNNSDSDEEAEFPNMTLYSKTSMTLANNVQDIPIPDAAYPTTGPNEFLDTIPETITTIREKVEEPPVSSPKEKTPRVELYSPSKKASSDSDSDVEEVKVGEHETVSRQSSEHQFSSDGEESSDDEQQTPRRKVKRSPVNTRRRTSRRRTSSDSSEVEEPSHDEKTNRRKGRRSSVCDERSSRSPSYDKGFSNASPRRKTSLGDNASVDVTHNLDLSEVCDITSRDSADVVIVDNKQESQKKDDDINEEIAEVETFSKADDNGSPKKKPKDDEEYSQVIDVDESEKDESQIETEKTDDEPKDDSVSELTKSDSVAGAYLLPSDDLDPVSDAEDNDFTDYQKVSSKERRRKQKKIRRRDSSVGASTKGERELEEGEIEDDKTKKKREATKKRRISESEERLSTKKQRRRKDRKDKSTGKENKEAPRTENTFTWKKLSKNTKERNYRDGKSKHDKLTERNKERESNKKKEKRKEMERYDVRKIVSEKPRTIRDEFGRDISAPRSRSRSASYNSRRRSKERPRRSLSQDDRWIDWSPVWTQRRSRSRSRRSRSRSRNRSRLSGDRYRNISKGRPREHDKRDSRKRRRSLSSIGRFNTTDKKRRRSRERSHRSGSYNNARLSRDISDHYYERSWTRTPSLYGNLTPPADSYHRRYDRSPSIIDPSHIALVSPEPGMLTPNPQNLTVIVPNVDVTKKKHKKKKESKKKKKKQPSKEVFTSGDNIVVSVNFDDNQKIISAKSSKRKTEEKSKKKKKNLSTRKKRKQILQVSEAVLNAKPVAVIDLNTSPCKEMSPMEVISLTDSGDETTTKEKTTGDRRLQTGDATNNSYVMTSAGPKTPPEPHVKFTVTSTSAMRTIPTNPIFVQDNLERVDSSHYNKGPNTPPEPSNATPNTTMYDPFEPTKSRSQSPVNADMYKERKEETPEGRKTIDIFADDSEKPSDNQANDKSKPSETNDGSAASASADESQLTKPSPAKESGADGPSESTQANGVNTLVLDLSSLGDDFVPKSSIPLVKTSQGKYEFQSNKTPDKPITVVIAQQNTSVKPQPQQVMVTPTRQIPTKPVEPIKQPMFPDILPWKLPPLSQASFTTPPPVVTTVTPTTITPSKSALAHNGNQDDSFDLDDSPYSPASSEGDDLFEPPPLNSASSPSKGRPPSLPAVNSYKSRVDALFNSSPVKKYPRQGPYQKPVSAIKGAKKMPKPSVGKKEVGIKADEEQLKILDDVPNSAVEMIVKEKFLKKLHRQERVVEEVKVVLKPHYAKKHITKEEYKDILRRAVPKICHNKTGDINPSKIQSLVEAYVKKIRHTKKKGSTMSTLPGSTNAPLFPSMGNTAKPLKKQKTMWG